MALTNKGSKWERKESVYVILSLIPIINCLAFFHMSSRVKNKKWSILGWLALVLNIVLIVVTVYFSPLNIDNPYEYPHSGLEAPGMLDYLNEEQYEKYLDDKDNYLDSAEFRTSEEYAAYKEDYEKYEKAYDEWYHSAEVTEQIEKHDAYNQRCGTISDSAGLLLIVVNIIFVVITLTERPKYLRLLAQSENKSVITERMQSMQRDYKTQTNNQTQKTQVKNITPKTIDVNSASEEEMAALNGLTIIDAKKAVSYREEHGGFNNADEFFACINAKPHIIVNIQNVITVGEYKGVKAEKEPAGKRRLDL